jgi:Rieske Fe-S protein
MDESTCTGGCACQRATDERGSVSRRGVLAGSAAAVAVMALGACASADETSSPGTATSSAPPSETPTESESATPAESQSPTGDASPAGEPLAGTGDFPVGGGVVVKTASGPVVVTHPADDEFLAFNGRCPHAGCPVTEVLENTIMCNCHGSTFDGSTGDRMEGPAPTGLEPVPIQVAGGEIYLA